MSIETESNVVSPAEASAWLKQTSAWGPAYIDLAHTVATEPDRIRAAVVKLLRGMSLSEWDTFASLADAIENGADF